MSNFNKNTKNRFGLFFLVIGLQISLFSSHIERDISRFGFRKISESPEIYECEAFLSDWECNHIIERAKPKLLRSTVVDLNSSKGLIDSSRTSLGAFLSKMGDPILINIRNRIEAITEIPDQNGEDLQVLHYLVGGEYRPHYDFFDIKTPGGLIHYNRGGQRVATLLLYLNTPERGGETIFPKASIKVQATKGKAVLFYNVDDEGQLDLSSLHGGEPVLVGEKWIATLWLREGEFR